MTGCSQAGLIFLASSFYVNSIFNFSHLHSSHCSKLCVNIDLKTGLHSLFARCMSSSPDTSRNAMMFKLIKLNHSFSPVDYNRNRHGHDLMRGRQMACMRGDTPSRQRPSGAPLCSCWPVLTHKPQKPPVTSTGHRRGCTKGDGDKDTQDK